MKSFYFVLKNSFLRSIIVSISLIQLGVWVRNFSVLMFVMEQTNNNPYAISLISVAQYAPMLFFSFIGGTFADRWNPKKTMVLCGFISSIFIMVILLSLQTGIWEFVFFVTLASSILSQFSQPSAMKLYKRHIPENELQSSLSMFQAVQSIFIIVGPAAGAFMFQSFGIELSLFSTAVLTLCSALVLLKVPGFEEEKEDNAVYSILSEMKKGLEYIIKKRVLITMGGCYIFAGLAVGLIQPMAVFIIIEKLLLPKEYVQFFMMTSGLSALLGSIFVIVLRSKMAPTRLLAMGMFINALCIIIIGFSEILLVTFSAHFFYGLFQPMIHIGINEIMVRTSRQQYLGRVHGFFNPLFMSMMVLMMSLVGFIKASFSLSLIYLFAGLLFFVGMLMVLPLLKIDLEKNNDNAQLVVKG